MGRNVAIALSALVVVAVPFVLVGNTLWLLLSPWFTEAQYALPGFPPDPGGLGGERRRDLAVTGLRSVRPGGEGIALLRDARLPGGQPAFSSREVSHMQDVRSVVSGALAAWAVGLGVSLAAGLALARRARPGSWRRAVRGGAGLTLVVMALAGAAMLVSFDALFVAFHGVFFEGDSWRFDSGSTLLRLYPETFWAVAAGAMAGLVLVQAAALLVGLRGRSRARREAARAG